MALQIAFPIVMARENKWFVASCPILDIATQGNAGSWGRPWPLLGATTFMIGMPESEAPLDEETRAALKWVEQLLADPIRFERWANETLDMSRMRKR